MKKDTKNTPGQTLKQLVEALLSERKYNNKEVLDALTLPVLNLLGTFDEETMEAILDLTNAQFEAGDTNANPLITMLYLCKDYIELAHKGVIPPIGMQAVGLHA